MKCSHPSMTGEGFDLEGRRLWRCDVCQCLGFYTRICETCIERLEVLEPGIEIHEDADLLEGGE